MENTTPWVHWFLVSSVCCLCFQKWLQRKHFFQARQLTSSYILVLWSEFLWHSWQVTRFRLCKPCCRNLSKHRADWGTYWSPLLAINQVRTKVNPPMPPRWCATPLAMVCGDGWQQRSTLVFAFAFSSCLQQISQEKNRMDLLCGF